MFRHSAVALAYYDEDGDRLQRRKAGFGCGCVVSVSRSGDQQRRTTDGAGLLLLAPAMTHAGAVPGRDD